MLLEAKTYKTNQWQQFVPWPDYVSKKIVNKLQHKIQGLVIREKISSSQPDASGLDKKKTNLNWKHVVNISVNLPLPNRQSKAQESLPWTSTVHKCRQTRWNTSTCFKLLFLCIIRSSFTPKVANGLFFAATPSVNMDGKNSIYFMANSDPFKSDFIVVWNIRSQLKGNWKTVTRKPCAYSVIYWKPWSP